MRAVLEGEDDDEGLKLEILDAISNDNIQEGRLPGLIHIPLLNHYLLMRLHFEWLKGGRRSLLWGIVRRGLVAGVGFSVIGGGGVEFVAKEFAKAAVFLKAHGLRNFANAHARGDQ